jgi:hypothetical protein
MTARGAHLALLAAALAAAPALARAFDVHGTLGAGATRNDSWTPTQNVSQPAWDFLGSLTITDLPLNPQAIQLSGSVDYRTYHSYYQSQSSASDGLGYRVTGTIAPQTSMPLVLGASRTNVDFTSGTGASVGSTLTQSETAGALLRFDGLPSVRGSVTRNDVTNRSFGVPDAKSAATTLSVGASQQFLQHQYELSYDTSWNEGSLNQSNYRLHNFTLEATTNIATGIQARIQDHYMLRTPTVAADFNPRYDDHSFGTGLSWQSSENLTTSVNYSYGHGIVDLNTAGLPATQESLTHGASIGTAYRLTPEWTLTGGVGANLSKARLDAVEDTSSSEQLTLGLGWNRTFGTSSIALTATGSGGAAHSAGATHAAYGAGASASYQAKVYGLDGSVTYGVNYASDLTGFDSRTFAQNASGSLSSHWRNASLGGSLSFVLADQDSRLFGKTNAQTATLTLNASAGRLGASAQAGLSHAFSNGLPTLGGDGLLGTAALENQSRFASANLSLAVTTNLTTSVTGRFAQNQAPGQPPQHEWGAGFSVGYTLGLFVFSLDDTYGAGGIQSGWIQYNQVFARVTRAFGSKF